MRVTTYPPSGFVDWGYPRAVKTIDGPYTLIKSDAGKMLMMDVPTFRDLYVPLNSSVSFPIGTSISIMQKGIGSVFITPGNESVLVRTASSLKLREQYAVVNLLKIGTDEWVVYGDLEEIVISTSQPTGGSDGDIWMVYS